MKYTLSGAICCEKKGSKGERCAIMWGELLEECTTFLEKYSLRCGRDTKNAPKEGACLYDFTREATELFYISRTRASDFTNKMFGVLKQDVRSLNTILKVSQEQKDSEFEH
jgi:hypothetical protein